MCYNNDYVTGHSIHLDEVLIQTFLDSIQSLGELFYRVFLLIKSDYDDWVNCLRGVS